MGLDASLGWNHQILRDRGVVMAEDPSNYVTIKDGKVRVAGSFIVMDYEPDGPGHKHAWSSIGNSVVSGELLPDMAVCACGKVEWE
jgi:hypothetical protein